MGGLEGPPIPPGRSSHPGKAGARLDWGRLARYALRQLPGWSVAGLVLLWLNALAGLPAWAVAVILALIVVKDLVLYPFMRQVFHPASDGMIGARGRTVEALAPVGYVRVNGELWRARAADPADLIPSGSAVIVREARGLTLLVEATGGVAPPPTHPTAGAGT
jgi:membrane protein implicated in regulation of membrane protease activity